MKIGILTFHRSHNYGAYLQAYALAHKIMRELDCEVEIIDYNMRIIEQRDRKLIFQKKNIRNIPHNIQRYLAFKKALQQLPVSLDTLISDDINEFQNFVYNKYDVIISGSDEVWRLGGLRGFPNPYWLPGNLRTRKVAYAASSRSDFNTLTERQKEELRNYINDFSYIGVRDQDTYESISRILGSSEKIHLNCDPTFTYDLSPDIENGRYILRKHFGIDASKKCIGFMCIDDEVVKKVIEKYDDKFYYISLYNKNPKTRSFGRLSPFEWLDVISALDFLVTSYFHGVCFSLKNNIPFVAIECRNNIDKNKSKSYDLLNRNNLLEHFFMKAEVKKIDKINAMINKYLINNEKVKFDGVVNSEKKLFESLLLYLQNIK